MINADTKRHIDSARQVLVGVVPNPTSQIDQITNALIYKFMDDMDQSAIKAGGDPSFFIGDLEPYAWTKIMSERLGHQERMNLYAEALVKFSQAKQLPQLFRDIFKSAYLPYRSPETLGLFLKEISYFDYAHPEDLGDAYEYLLSIMSSQGDAGQFRTPRNIIDFMVDVVNPTKDDKVLDPACGTGGFLVSSYKHIIEQHDGKDDAENTERPLTPEQRKKLFTNFEGYDIDPGMVRIAQVNMYLHQFKNPQVSQYDTLTQEERWGQKYSVVLANPPFMSPQGGIRPHNKFSLPSNRSEVLFVDYIMNHLTPKGRAGIIVPEGIIFKSDTATKALRKALVEDGLYAVVSLPAGVFNPYAGVKTSILLFDNEHAKQSDELLFVKVENDGFDLGAQRRPINKNDLPEALRVLNAWRQGAKVESSIAQWVPRSKIAESGDYNLSAAKYFQDSLDRNSSWPMVELRSVCKVLNGFAFKSALFNDQGGGIPLIRIRDVNSGFSGTYYSGEYDDKFLVDNGDLLIGMDGDFIATLWSNGPALLNQRVCKLTEFNGVLKNYIYYIIQRELDTIHGDTYAVTVKHISAGQIESIKVPLPPLEVQHQIVAELDGYQRIIDGARQIVDNWKPSFVTDPAWPKKRLGEIGRVSMCKRIFKEQTQHTGDIPFYKIGTFGKNPDAYISRDVFDEFTSKYPYPTKGSVLLSTSGTIGRTVIFDGEPAYFQDSNIVWLDHDESIVLNSYLYYFYQTTNWNTTKGGTIERLYNKDIESTEIPLPPLEVQKQIVDTIEAERAHVESARTLIDLYTQKTQSTIAKLWSE